MSWRRLRQGSMKRNSIDLPPQEISRRLVSPFTTKRALLRARTLGSQRRKLQRMPAFNARRQSLCIFCNQISPHRLAPASTNERIASHFVIRSSHFEDNWYHRERTARGDGNSCRQRLLVPTLARSEVWQRFTGSQKNSAEYDDPVARRMPLRMVSTSFIQPERDTRLKQ